VRIQLNERELEVEAGKTLMDLRREFRPDADIVIWNGAPMVEDQALSEGDRVVLIRRGEMPDSGELEALMVARHTPGVHERVRRASVGIAGLGGLGSAVAIALARVGVGRLVLVDFDVVEPSNLNRQQYFVDQIGMHKTAAMADNLKRINPHVKCETHDLCLTPSNVPVVFRDVDVLVEAFDRSDQKVMLLESFATAFPQKPVVMASGLAGFGPGETIGVRRIGRGIFVVGDMVSAAQPGQGLMAPRVGIAAHMEANLVLRLLMGEEGR